MPIRPAQLTDIPAMHRIRLAVKENVLNTPGLVTEAHYAEMLNGRGMGWVAKEEGQIAGFAIVDFALNNVWALFVDPDFEAKGLGSALHDEMLRSAKAKGVSSIWLTTAPHTRAAEFYTRKGWFNKGLQPSGELRFEIAVQR